MKRFPAWTSWLVVGLLATSTTAYADLSIDTGAPPAVRPTSSVPAPASSAPMAVVHPTPVAPPVVVPGHVTQVGTAPTAAGQPLKGWAQGVPLLTALQQITPDGWKARRVGPINVDQLVSWTGGQPWLNVLTTLAETYGFDATVNWSTQEVTVSVTKALHAEVAMSDDGQSLAKAISTKPLPPEKHWYLSPKLTLKGNVEAWAKEAGWTVSWSAADYPIVAGMTLSGDIDASDGPIAVMMKAYEDAEQPLVAHAEEANKVIRVENRDYEQNAVEAPNLSSAIPDLSNR